MGLERVEVVAGLERVEGVLRDEALERQLRRQGAWLRSSWSDLREALLVDHEECLQLIDVVDRSVLDRLDALLVRAVARDMPGQPAFPADALRQLHLGYCIVFGCVSSIVLYCIALYCIVLYCI